MKKLSIFALAAIMVLALALSAQAVPTISDPWDPVTGAEKNLYQIFADPLFNGGSFASSQAIANVVPIVDSLPAGLQQITVSVYAKFASFTQNPGFYLLAAPSIHQYFSSFSTNFPATTDGIFTVTDWPDVISVAPFGFFDDNTASGGDIKFTELALNSGGFAQSNGLIFQISATQYIIAFEDGAGANSLGDYDYNDLVLNVTAVPLPPSTLLLGSGLLGLVAWRRRIFG